MLIENNYLVEKRNVLNEVRSNSMTLQELRFFSIYLARINARDISTRIVRFPIAEFQRIMELGRINVDYLMNVTKALLRQIVSVPNEEKEGYTQFQLFKKCRVDKNEKDEWYVEIDAHDDALPLMFEFKDKYFTYKLWNIFRLKSTNHIRMYELLKQYESLGERTLSLDALKEMLGFNKSEYPRFDNFRVRVLDGCQEALSNYTDITFKYEPIRKRGRGRQVTAIKFIIVHNQKYADAVLLDDYLDAPGPRDDEIDNIPDTKITKQYKSERLAFLAEACNKEFTESEMQVIQNLLTANIPYEKSEHFIIGNRFKYETELYDFLKLNYDNLNLQAEKRKIKSRFGYLKKMLEPEAKENDE